MFALRGTVHLAAAGSLVVASMITAAPAGAITTSSAPLALTGPTVFGGGFEFPASVSVDGTHVWVANYDGNSLTELDRSTGRLVREFPPSDGFNSPQGVSSDGTHVWVANSGGNSVTELDAATGALVKVIKGPGTGSSIPGRCPRMVPTSGS
jgi:DNA-binding beta-propeller fold protein YncE